MTKTEFIAMLEDVIEAAPGSITEERLISDLEGWDSLAVIAFIARVDEQCQITLSPKGIEDSRSVRDLINLLGDAVTA